MIVVVDKVKLTLDGKEVTGHKLTVASEILIDLDTAWRKLKTSALLEFITNGKVKFLPTGGQFPEIWEQGSTVTTRMLLYCFIPFGGLHSLYFEKIDDANKVLITKEFDMAAKIWNHKISMRKISENKIYYEDEILIYGGLLTIIISWWAKSFYIHRQKRWRLIAKQVGQ